ncbi:hypothetical protein BIW11_03884 [Tropilaelaps mercedesae]|uniref:Uncharacterized protein n=1 Tax=Tropilaelaps mercedesae TaxID=418985 RepID=A0A1V9XEQ2_9ACAR|nr:hypothetical protein BIW11_03884 [Tropilaelaps mercedesae]
MQEVCRTEDSPNPKPAMVSFFEGDGYDVDQARSFGRSASTGENSKASYGAITFLGRDDIGAIASARNE